MGNIRKKHSEGFKFKVALAALKGDKTSVELCREFGIASAQLFKWRKQVLEHGAEIFSGNSRYRHEDKEKVIARLHEKIGQLTVEKDFLAKALGY